MRTATLTTALDLVRTVPGFPADDPAIARWVRGALRTTCASDDEAMFVAECHAKYCPKWDGTAEFRRACGLLVARRRRDTPRAKVASVSSD